MRPPLAVEETRLGGKAMMYTHAIAVVLVAGNGLIDKMELETSIPKSDRNWLAQYQLDLASKNTRVEHDLYLLEILRQWMQHRHRITA